VSVLGYVAFGLLLYALLVQRFSARVSFAVAAACLLFPPLRTWSFHPLTDSWGLALLVAALLAAVLVLDRGIRWLAFWLLAVIALAFTRDALLVVVPATAWVAFRLGTRASLALPASAALLGAVPLLLFGGSLREHLAYLCSEARIPPEDSWSYISGACWDNVADELTGDFSYPVEHWGVLPGVVAFGVLALALGMLLFRAPRRDSFFVLHKAALVGGLVAIALAPQYSSLRLELIFAPPLAVGLALVAVQVAPGVRSWVRAGSAQRGPLSLASR
jgi:hypothetical protein